MRDAPNPQTLALGLHREHMERELQRWREEDRVRRLWAKDASLWTGRDEARWLGWLEAPSRELHRVQELERLGLDILKAGFTSAVVLGMGGSSLCPDVLSRSFGERDGYPRLHVLDSTVPPQIADLEKRLELDRTLFIVASKSGTTAEPNAFERYFFAKVPHGDRFLAITDPDSALERLAREKRYRGIVLGEPEIGGRYSALSPFGLAPAAIMGLEPREILERALEMARACGPEVPVQENPGVVLGVAMGTLARDSRDKLTLVLSPEIAPLGGWLEQLIAESTGKEGKGIVPVDGETLGAPELYGDDRFFVYVGVGPSKELAPFEAAGHPVVEIVLDSVADLAQEFFRWEMATAVAGSVLRVNPFDQPDVEATKVETRALISRFERTGELPAPPPPVGTEDLAVLLGKLRPGDYFAINAFLAMNEENDRELQALRHAVRDGKRVATTLGYGPRFLHSTGQLHKGGPATGVFLHITSDEGPDRQVPGQRQTFGQMSAFQAAGDFAVLKARGRRALAVHLGADVPSELRKLRRLLAP